MNIKQIKKMNENKKCYGCGIILTSNINNSGYTPVIEKAKLCQRCFRLKYYNKLDDSKNEDKILSHINNVLKNFDFSKVTTFFVCSPSQLPFNIDLIHQLQTISKDFYLLISKIDTLVNYDNINLITTKLYDYVKKIGINIIDHKIIPCSYFKNKNFIEIKKALLNANKNKSKIAFCGITNTGKSSIINWIIKREKINTEIDLTISYYKNTTQDIKQIKTKHFTLLDLPGFVDTNGFQSIMNTNQLKRFYSNYSKWKTKIFQLKNNRIFKIENLLTMVIKIDKLSSCLITYFNDSLKINSTNLKNKKFLININDNLNCVFESKLQYKYNLLVLDGLGFVVLKNILEIKIIYPSSLNKPFLIKNYKF